MTTVALITTLRRQGVQLEDQGGILHVRFSKSEPLSDAVKQEIRARKQEILTRLRNGGVSMVDLGTIFPNTEVVTLPATESPWGYCPFCKGKQWWVSKFFIRSCTTCFPPSDKDMVYLRLSPSNE